MILGLGIAAIGLILLGIEMFLSAGSDWQRPLLYIFLLVYASAQILFIAYAIGNHLGFPLNLDLMESTILQHAERAAALRPIYTDPAPDFVALSYNPLFYYLCAPAIWLLGPNLTTLRLVASLGYIGAGLMLFWIVWWRSRSAAIALIATGLFAAAYRVMDTYLDKAHSDAWMLLAALGGTFLLARARSQANTLAAIAILMLGFWFKQHGALFALGGLAYVLLRDGLRRSIPAIALAAVLGPGIYRLLGKTLFGPDFLFFTYQVPAGWTQPFPDSFARLVKLMLLRYPALTVGALAASLGRLIARAWRPGIWEIQFLAAAATAGIGVLDPGSADNVLIPLGTWLILEGTIGLARLLRSPEIIERRIGLIAVLTSFALLAYQPTEALVTPGADLAYQDLIGELDRISGTVYAPSIGQLPADYRLQPAMHWVALDDMMRGPHHLASNQAVVGRLLCDTSSSGAPAFILLNADWAAFPVLHALEPGAELVEDYGDRFEALKPLPGRFDHRWPRYLYKLAPDAACAPEPQAGLR